MSHFITLVNIAADETDTERQAYNIGQIAAGIELKKKLAENPDDYTAEDMLNDVLRNPSPFECRITAAIDDIMAPFCQDAEDPDYIEFENVTAEITKSYKTDLCDCVRLPDGKIITCHNSLFYNYYMVADGVIYQKLAGRLRRPKRTKKAKKLRLLSNYPLRKAYKTFERYAEDHCCCEYSEDESGYGYYCNPNGVCDWYQVGGRWPYKFLVRDTTAQVITGEKSWTVCGYEPDMPDGYKWVAGAKKSDIEWGLMKSLKEENTVRAFNMYEEWHKTGMIPDGGVTLYNETVYERGETYEEWLNRRCITVDLYADFAYSYIQDGEFYSTAGAESENEWVEMVKEYIGNIPGDDIIVTVDCHT
ncbi:MAG: hypothetical protein FWD71_23150 [Oscillospiraceae bacterium]|nr:hypothetical protein [Oscillospiraceae bacterium]